MHVLMSALLFVPNAALHAAQLIAGWFNPFLAKARELGRATHGWKDPVLVRTYRNDKAGQKLFGQEARILGKRGYLPTTQGATGSHVNVGRTVTAAALTGGISLLFGGSRSQGSITVTYQRA